MWLVLISIVGCAHEAKTVQHVLSIDTESPPAEILRQDWVVFITYSSSRRNAFPPVPMLPDGEREDLRLECEARFARIQKPDDDVTCATVAACQWEAPSVALDCACWRCLDRFGGGDVTGCSRRAARADISASCENKR